MMRLLQFAAPDPAAFPSGGNHYNAMVAQALERRGVQVRWCPPAALDPAQPALWDTLWMRAWRPARAPQWLVVHHLQWLWPEQPLGRDEERALLARFDGLVATSPFTAGELRRAGIGRPVVVAPPGVRWHRPQGVALPPWPLHILWSGNFIPRKGLAEWLATLLPHAALLAGRGHRITLLGDARADAAYGAHCLRLVGKLNRAAGSVWVRHAGAVSPGSVPGFLAKANLFVSTARMETWGMAIAEAAAFGLPVWVCRGGFAERHLERGAVGQAFDDAARLTDALVRLDRPTFEQMQAEALAADPDYPDWDATAAAIVRAIGGVP